MWLELSGPWGETGDEDDRTWPLGPSMQSLVHQCEVCGFYFKSKEII